MTSRLSRFLIAFVALHTPVAMVGAALLVPIFAIAQEREGNFGIRFEPTAKLQTATPVPFSIVVRDALRKPLVHASVRLLIEDKDSLQVEAFRAPETEAGTYVAKPIFRTPGEWTIVVQVDREGAKSERSLKFQVSE